MAAPQVHSGLGKFPVFINPESKSVIVLDSFADELERSKHIIKRQLNLREEDALRVQKVTAEEFQLMVKLKVQAAASKEASAAKSAGITPQPATQQQPAVQQRSTEEIRQSSIKDLKSIYDNITRNSLSQEQCREKLSRNCATFDRSPKKDYLKEVLKYFIREFQRDYPEESKKENQASLACSERINMMIRQRSPLLLQPIEFWS